MKPEDEAIETLARAILRDARDEADQIQVDAQGKVDEIRQRALEQAQAERNEILERARQGAERLRGQVIATAQLKARTLQLDHRERLLARVFKAAEERLSGIQKRSDYDRIAAGLLREAVSQLNAKEVQIRADALTQKILKEGPLDALSSELGLKVLIREPLEEGIGVIVDTLDGHLHYDNTLETRLGRLQNSLRSPVYQVLMGEKL